VKSLEEYRKLNYRMEIEFNSEEKAYFVNFPELPGCMADGKTPNEAVKEAVRVKNKWLEIAIKSGWSVPEPQTKYDTSGRLTVRLPKYLHKKLIEHAEQEGVSQNQLIVAYVSEGLEKSAAEDSFKRIEQRITSAINCLVESTDTIAYRGHLGVNSVGSVGVVPLTNTGFSGSNVLSKQILPFQGATAEPVSYDIFEKSL